MTAPVRRPKPVEPKTLYEGNPDPLMELKVILALGVILGCAWLLATHVWPARLHPVFPPAPGPSSLCPCIYVSGPWAPDRVPS